MQFTITFKTIFEYILKKLVLCIQIRFVSTEKTTRIASRASCSVLKSNLFIRALLLDRILVTEKTTRTPRVHLVYRNMHWI